MYLINNRFGKAKTQSRLEAVQVIDKVERVCKLVVVEGNVSEILDFSQRKGLLTGLIPAEKKALLTVKAKVLVGYDLKKMRTEVDSEDNEIRVILPEPEVFAIDSDVRFYDVQDSWLNRFHEEDYTTLLQESKTRIKGSDAVTSFLKDARLQTKSMLNVLSENSGWTITPIEAEQQLPEGKENEAN